MNFFWGSTALFIYW